MLFKLSYLVNVLIMRSILLCHFMCMGNFLSYFGYAVLSIFFSKECNKNVLSKSECKPGRVKVLYKESLTKNSPKYRPNGQGAQIRVSMQSLIKRCRGPS